MLVPFQNLPDHARVWVFPILENIDSEKAISLEKDLNDFVNEWTSHNMALQGSAKVLDDKLAIISVDESNHGASGCSIDKLMRFIQNLEGEYQINLLNKTMILVKKDKELKALALNEIKLALASGYLKPTDHYYDILVDNIGKLKSELLKQLDEGWISKRLMN